MKRKYSVVNSIRIIALICGINIIPNGFGIIAFAQENPKFGLVFGFNRTSLSGDDASDAKSKFGFSLGGYGIKTLQENISVRGELLYTTKGAKFEFTSFGTVRKSWINLNYIALPVMIQFDFPSDDKFRPLIYAGPEFALVTTAKVKEEVAGDSIEEDVKDEIKSTELSLVIGGGINTEFNDRPINISLRYTIGLSTIDKESDGDEAGDLKNNSFSLLIGYIF